MRDNIFYNYDFDVATKSIKCTDEINIMSKLILENKKVEVVNYSNILLDRFKNEDDIHILKILAFRLITNIDMIFENLNYYEWDNRKEIITLIINISSASDRKYLCEYFRDFVEWAFYKIDDTFEYYSPIIWSAIIYINNNYSKNINVKKFSDEYNMNSSYLGRKFKVETGVSFLSFLNQRRNYVAKELMINTDKKIIDISFDVGYQDISNFYKHFKRIYGVSPGKFRDIKRLT